MNQYTIGEKDLVLCWHILKPDGNPFSLDDYNIELFYVTGRGTNAVTSFIVSGSDNNIVQCTFIAMEQVYTGRYSMRMKLKNKLDGKDFCTITYKDCFALGKVDNSMVDVLVFEDPETVTVDIFTSMEFASIQSLVTVKKYDELDATKNEDTSVVATAYSVARVKEDIGMDGIDEFDATKTYARGDVVRHNGKGYRFTQDKEPGPWNSSYLDFLRYASLAKPVSISESIIKNLE